MDDEGTTQRRTIKVVTQGGREAEFEIEVEILPARRAPTEEDRRLWKQALLVIGMIAEMMGLPPIGGGEGGKNGSK